MGATDLPPSVKNLVTTAHLLLYLIAKVVLFILGTSLTSLVLRLAILASLAPLTQNLTTNAIPIPLALSPILVTTTPVSRHLEKIDAVLAHILLMTTLTMRPLERPLSSLKSID